MDPQVRLDCVVHDVTFPLMRRGTESPPKDNCDVSSQCAVPWTEEMRCREHALTVVQWTSSSVIVIVIVIESLLFFWSFFAVCPVVSVSPIKDSKI